MQTLFFRSLVFIFVTVVCSQAQTVVNRETYQERSFRSSFSGGPVSAPKGIAHYPEKSESSSTSSYDSFGDNCNDDAACLALASCDRLGLEAIKSLHRQLDDDANGNVDLSESDEFLREELKYEQGYEKRQKAFHRNDDMHISVKELWEAWLRSEVHNWTVEQTTEWLATNVELPQYIPTFVKNQVTGACLPGLAVNNMQYLNKVLGIHDPIHKQKITLKAMDVVLFGAPKDYSHHLKDLVLVTLLVVAMGGCWYAYQQNKRSQKHLSRMMKDMESLQKAEYTLMDLQKELERARHEQECVTTEKQNLERRLQEQAGDPGELRTSYSDLEVSQLKAEIEMLRGELQRAEGELEDRCWSPPVGLQHWLQLTHEIENKAYIKKKASAEKQLLQAREACEKLRKKRSSLVGAFVSTHGKSIDDVDRSIVEARTSLNEVTQELQERVYRWKQMELLCGFNIINNAGLAYLESILYRGMTNGRPAAGMRGRLRSSQDDLDDDTGSIFSSHSTSVASSSPPPVYHEQSMDQNGALGLSSSHRLSNAGGSSSPGTGSGQGGWKEGVGDSSGSEAGKEEIDDFPQDSSSVGGAVQFTVGESNWRDDRVATTSRRGGMMVRSYSQDTNFNPVERDGSPPKTSQSESCLDSAEPAARTPPTTVNSTILSTSTPSSSTSNSSLSNISKGTKEASPSSASVVSTTQSTLKSISGVPPTALEEETYSTDSNSTAEDEARRKRRKIHFPTFSRKPKTKFS
ncbi:stromal interaction molecule homolog isoform X2 [Ischnura elegans]|uniref:stromal interaction molecule homolog isoform X2 n=1 Tax=Ischnura elegans TaxID=197161 RepID=UPI001ED8B992|nr:stromal interaction molecule homolog isoform X2 [Ischnura elegans]